MRRATDWTSAILSDNVISLLPSLLEMGAAEAGAVAASPAVDVPEVVGAAAAAASVVVVVVAAAMVLADDGYVVLFVRLDSLVEDVEGAVVAPAEGKEEDEVLEEEEETNLKSLVVEGAAPLLVDEEAEGYKPVLPVRDEDRSAPVMVEDDEESLADDVIGAAAVLAPMVEDDVDSLFCTPALPDPAMFPSSICFVPDNEDDVCDEVVGRDAV